MAKQYSPDERHEAVKLAGEIGARAASERLGINLDTLYTWMSKARKRSEAVEAAVREKGPEGLLSENERLKKELREQEQEIEILQDALGFFAKRRKK
jgi:transposase